MQILKAIPFPLNYWAFDTFRFIEIIYIILTKCFPSCFDKFLPFLQLNFLDWNFGTIEFIRVSWIPSSRKSYLYRGCFYRNRFLCVMFATCRWWKHMIAFLEVRTLQCCAIQRMVIFRMFLWFCCGKVGPRGHPRTAHLLWPPRSMGGAHLIWLHCTPTRPPLYLYQASFGAPKVHP